jgi:hypothetical protein
MPERAFKHSGNLADIIFSLPAVKALGGGILYLDVNGGRGDPFIAKNLVDERTRFDIHAYQVIRPLLAEQSYIKDVRIWNGEAVDVNLDGWRSIAADPRTNISAIYMRMLGLREDLVHEPWLSISAEPLRLHKDLLVNRTLRLQSKYHIWQFDKAYWLERGVFIGLPIEHEWFEHAFSCKIDFHPTADALEIARVLRGGRKLIANQGFIMSIAIGLGVPFLQETYHLMPNCQFGGQIRQYF